MTGDVVSIGVAYFPLGVPGVSVVAWHLARSSGALAGVEVGSRAWHAAVLVARTDAAEAFEVLKRHVRAFNLFVVGWVAMTCFELPAEPAVCPRCRGRSTWCVGNDPSDVLNVLPNICDGCEAEIGVPS